MNTVKPLGATAFVRRFGLFKMTWRIFWTSGIETTALLGSNPDELPGLMSGVPVVDSSVMSAV